MFDKTKFEARLLADPNADNVWGWKELIAAFDGDAGKPPRVLDDLGLVEQAFDSSVVRIHALCSLPDRVWVNARSFERLRGHALAIESGRFHEGDGEDTAKIALAFARLVNWVRDPSTIPDDIARHVGIASSPGAFLSNLRLDERFREECRAILESVVTGVFGAFEVLAGDLWEAAVNQRPRAAMTRFLKAQSPGQEKQIPLSVLETYNFNLFGHVGTILRETEKVDFNSMRATQAAYERAFGKEVATVFSDEQLMTLELVRNLLAHRGGMTDARFISKLRDVTHPFGSLEVRTPVRLNGMIVSRYVVAVRTAADGLSTAVRRWIESVPT